MRRAAPGWSVLAGLFETSPAEAEAREKALGAALARRAEPDLLVARARARVFRGRGEDALADLDAARAKGGEAALLRGAALGLLGRVEEACAALAGAGGAARDESEALRALLLAQSGRGEEGLRVLDALVRRRPGHSLALALRGMLRRDRLDLAGAREDLDRAAAQEPRAWILSHRADVLNRMGFYKLALEDMKRLAAAMPRAAEPRAQAANILFDQAYYKEALAEMRAAVARRPGDPALRARLATFLQVLGLLAEAERELRAVERLEPGNEQARYQRLLTAIRRGRAASALRELSRGALPKLLADHLRGYADARAGRWAQARRRFEAVAAADPSGPWARKAEFYALVARVLQDPAVRRERPKPDPWITLCGIGILHPYELTLEGLLALTECDTIFNNLGDPQVDEFLALFPARVRAVSRVFGEPAMGRARRIVATLRRGRRAGFVTRIHPFIYRRIANDLVELCRSKRIPFEAFPGVSLTEFAWGLGRAALPADRASRPRLRVFDIGFATRRPDLISARDASVFYCIAGDRERSALAGALRASREASLETALLAGSGDREHQVSRHRVDEVEAPLVAADGGAVLYVPAGGGRR